MPAADSLTETDLELLWEDVPVCESSHRTEASGYFGPCGVEAIARWRASCDPSKDILVCERVFFHASALIATNKRTCSGCKRHVGECWTIFRV